jgi:hypothetical protein
MAVAICADKQATAAADAGVVEQRMDSVGRLLSPDFGTESLYRFSPKGGWATCSRGRLNSSLAIAANLSAIPVRN